ncbi:MAG TPA: 30S ribosome-binding factor RbfA [Burkholderiales bacterium]|nr:30S ribosome-binding factor RbfA [Burkholderiales bacterium]
MTRGRPQKVADQIQRELSLLLSRELRDPRLGLVTLTAVDVAPDLSHAVVYFTCLDAAQVEPATTALQHAAGYLRTHLAKRIKLYTTPELRFRHDESVARGAYLSQLIDSVRPKR